MDNKLTLKLDNQVIEKAKLYAKNKNTSLSKLVESYLLFITTINKAEKEEISPLVKSLSGVFDAPKLTDFNDAYKKHLGKKYSS